MPLTVTHSKVSAIPDDPAAVAAGEVVPSDWNADHAITGAAEFAQATKSSSVPASPYNISSADHGKVIKFRDNGTGSYLTAALPSRASVADGFYVWIVSNASAATEYVKLTPNAGDGLNGNAGDIDIYDEGSALVIADANLSNNWLVLANNRSFEQLAPSTTKGDLIVHDGTASARLPVGANDYVLTADSTTATGVKWAPAAGGGGGGSADIQQFTTVGTSTWTKPVGAKLVHVVLHGGGGGGGGGRRRGAAAITTTGAGGGGGGGAGGRTEYWLPATAFGSTASVTVGSGGSGGVAATVDATSGGTGNSGSLSSVDTIVGVTLRARPGQAGGGGSTTAGASGVSGGSMAFTHLGGTLYVGSGGAGSTSASSDAPRGGLGGGGGSGGCGFATNSTASATAGNGGLGGAITGSINTSTGGGGNPSTAGANAPDNFFGGSGGGGGSVTSTTAGSGGAGGYPGGGGGGGGAASGSFNSGAGGVGGDGFVRITTFF